MHYALFVCSAKNLGNFACYANRFCPGERTFDQAASERLAFDELHGDESLALKFTRLVNLANVRMINSGCGTSLADKAVSSHRIRISLEQELKRNSPVQ